MADQNGPEIPVANSKGDQSDGSSGSGGISSTGVDKPPEGDVEWMFAAMKQHGNDIDIPVKEENADRELTDAEIEAFDLEEGTNLSIESLFGYTVERPFVGDPTVSKDWFDAEEEAKEFADENNLSTSQVGYSEREEAWYVNTKLSDEEGSDAIDRHVTVNLGHAINGHFTDLIDDTFGEDVHIRVGMGASGLYDDDRERAKNVRVKTTNSAEKSRRRKKKAQFECDGVGVSKADYEEWCEENEVDPYPRS